MKHAKLAVSVSLENLGDAVERQVINRESRHLSWEIAMAYFLKEIRQRKPMTAGYER
jgi:ribonuclease P protein component